MKRLLIIATAFLIGILAMNSCVKEYTITVTSNNSEWGTVAGTGTYLANSEIVITAIPSAGYYFIKWDDENTDNPRTVIVNGDKTYQAIFSNNPNGGGLGGGGNTSVNFNGNISENTTWPDLGLEVDYIVEGWINIEGNALLTIEPGVTIMFTGVDGGMGVGENAGLRMVGTADRPIKFVGPLNNPNNGSWNGITISSKRNDNQFEYVQFLRGGSDDGNWAGVVHLRNGHLSMKNCLIDGSLGIGIDCEYEDSYFTAFENNTVKNCAATPWKCEYFPAACKNIGTGNTFVNNGFNMVHIENSAGTLEENLTLHELSIPYYFLQGTDFRGNKTMTIEAGVNIVMHMNEGINVDDECQFKAEGTADKPIVFRCEDEDEAWNGILFRSTRNGNVLKYCQIKNCGAEDSWSRRSCLYIRSNAKLAITNNVFGSSNYNGVGIENISNWSNVTHSGNTFVGCAGGNVWVESEGDYNGNHYESGQILTDLPE